MEKAQGHFREEKDDHIRCIEETDCWAEYRESREEDESDSETAKIQLFQRGTRASSWGTHASFFPLLGIKQILWWPGVAMTTSGLEPEEVSCVWRFTVLATTASASDRAPLLIRKPYEL
ncbi:hypothetical protein HII31_06508 [Pseudocercospora fuligena]|uniref:Uncharacterized protein n=1 Tax=Pseudocercospora fuligena TaxID=685502 RepID=A0A8H6RJQ7_9PEZI|nr:hypothetical protein HII31_06508 [Pseudocercospora fuligena]